MTVSDFWRLSIASWFPVVSWICHPNQLSIIIDNQVQSCISTRERLDFVPHRSYFLKCLTGEAPLQLHLRIAAVGKDPWHLDRIQRVKVIFQNINDILENSCGNPDRKSTRLNSSHVAISYAVFCCNKKKKNGTPI